MRLLNTSTFKSQLFGEDEVPLYAILSHTWNQNELSFQDLQSVNFTHLPGYAKINGACKAIQQQYEWIWIDTCCIDKTSSAELSQSINSMYEWYEKAAVCFVYLQDFEVADNRSADPLRGLEKCKWFYRGWTLQELIAPSRVEFWDQNFTKFGTKLDMYGKISFITGIPFGVLQGACSPRDCNVAERMSWASSRRTTRSEDMAYCLLGLFDVKMVPIYGEGSYQAFMRLQKKILKQSNDQSIFIWSPKHDQQNLGLLASTPMAFCRHSDCLSWIDPSNSRYAWGFSSPYALLLPLDSSPQAVNAIPIDSGSSFAVSTAALLGHYTAATGDITPTLGSQGLQLSLLASEDVPSGPIRSAKDYLKTKPIVCLDLMVMDRTEKHGNNVLLPLMPDMTGGYENHNMTRRGFLKRGPISQYKDICYRTSSSCRRFIRKRVCISQLEPNELSTLPVSFEFARLPSTATVTGMTVDHRHDGSIHLKAPVLGTAITGFGCRIAFKHSMSRDESVNSACHDIPFIISFGVHGPRPQGWCSISAGTGKDIVISELENPSIETHREIDSHNSRHKSQAYAPLPCNHRVFVSMLPSRPGSFRQHSFTLIIQICEFPDRIDIKRTGTEVRKPFTPRL